MLALRGDDEVRRFRVEELDISCKLKCKVWSVSLWIYGWRPSALHRPDNSECSSYRTDSRTSWVSLIVSTSSFSLFWWDNLVAQHFHHI